MPILPGNNTFVRRWPRVGTPKGQGQDRPPGTTDPHEPGRTVEFRSGKSRLLTTVVAVALAAASLTWGVVEGGTAGASTIPSSAFKNHTGVTKTEIKVANVSTETEGLFTGATVGIQAYADYVNSKGGINGRKIVVNVYNDDFTGAGNKQATQNAIDNDFAMVGDFSLEDSFGGTLLKANPDMPDISQVLDPATGKLPNVVSAVPLAGGWQQGPIEYLKKTFPNDLRAAGALVGGLPSAETDWVGEKNVLQKVGFHVIYDPTYGVYTTDFTPNVIAMKNMGVKILFVDSMAESYASALFKAMAQQNYHPQVVLGAATYTNTLAADSGGAANINGDYLEQNLALYLGGDESAIPAVGTFLHWVHVANPSFHPDLYTLYSWISGELFGQALKNAGSDPSRGSELQALSKITSFNANNLIASNDPATKALGNCYIIGKVVNGTFQRVGDPPVTGSTHGYRCDYSYIYPPS